MRKHYEEAEPIRTTESEGIVLDNETCGVTVNHIFRASIRFRGKYLPVTIS